VLRQAYFQFDCNSDSAENEKFMNMKSSTSQYCLENKQEKKRNICSIVKQKLSGEKRDMKESKWN
jgi:hypothetical protein